MLAELTEGDLFISPRWFPLRVANDDSLLLIDLDQDAYRACSFLDERLLTLNRAQARCNLPVIQKAAAERTRCAHYLFHLGHVGSTLISRLIGEHRSFFSLREPGILRQQVPFHGLSEPLLPLNALLALLARTWGPEQRAVIKATSFVSEIGCRILAGSEHPHAILLTAHPLAYLRGILGGPNSRAESKLLAQARLARLVNRIPSIANAAKPLSEGEWIATSWLCEMTALCAISQRYHSATHWVDFDRFLLEPAAVLTAILRKLGADPAEREIETLVSGSIMHRYSKAPEYAYDAELRRQVLMSAEQEYGSEIARGMRWIETLFRQNPELESILEAHG